MIPLLRLFLGAVALWGCMAPGGAIRLRRAAPAPCTEAPPSPGVTCNLRGRLKDDYQLFALTCAPAQVSSVKQCAFLCAKHKSSCASFEFDPDALSCQFLRTGAAESVDPASNSTGNSRIYNDRGCYDCGSFCGAGNQPYGKQLLDNGGFEEVPLGPWCIRKAISMKGGYHSPRRAMLYDRDVLPYNSYGYDLTWNFLSQTFPSCLGAYYDARLDYKFGKYDAGGAYSYVAMGDRYFYFAPRGTAAQGTWSPARVIMRAETGGTYPMDELRIIRLYGYPFYDDPLNRLSIDNVRLHRRSAPKPVRGSTSPTGFNGDFESGNAAPWKLVTYRSETSAPQNLNGNITSPGLGGSKYAIKLEKHGEVFAFDVEHRNVGTTASTMYILGFDVLNRFENAADPATSPQLAVSLSLYSGATYSQHIFYCGTIASGPQSLSWPLFVQGNTADVVIRISFCSNDALTGSFTLDNISLRPMAEDE